MNALETEKVEEKMRKDSVSVGGGIRRIILFQVIDCGGGGGEFPFFLGTGKERGTLPSVVFNGWCLPLGNKASCHAYVLPSAPYPFPFLVVARQTERGLHEPYRYRARPVLSLQHPEYSGCHC